MGPAVRIPSAPPTRHCVPVVHFRSRSTVGRWMHTVVANLSSQSSYRLRPTPVSRGAFRHQYLSLRICSYWGSLMRSVAQIARLSAGLCCWYAHQTLTPTVRKIRRIPLNPRRRAQGAMNGAQRLDTRLAAHGKRAAIVFRPPFPCEVRTMKLGRYQECGRTRPQDVPFFAWIKFRKGTAGAVGQQR